VNPRTLIALAAVAATAAVIYATASSASPNAWTVERYYSNETSHVFADIGAKGAGPADVYVAQQSLRSTGGEKVGVVNGYGVNLHRPYVFFHWTAALDAGTLTVEGAVDLRRDVQVYAIVGGTGRYAGARGTVTSSDAGKRGSLVVVRYER
jgi:hypothetical protein